jgi:IS5 family transposase
MLGKNASPQTCITVGADKAYDVAEHVVRLRVKNITPHIAVNAYVTKTGQARKTSIGGRTTRHKGYSLSQGKRNMIERMVGGGSLESPPASGLI